MTVRITNGPFILSAVNPRSYTITLVETYDDEASALNGLAKYQADNPKFHYMLEARKTYWSTSE